MSRLSLSNIDENIFYRLQRESDFENLTLNEIVEQALDDYFIKLDKEREKEDPPEPIDIDLESKENKKLLEKFKQEREAKEREIELSEINIKEVKRDFDYKNYEFREFARKLNDGYLEGTVLKIHSISLVEIMVKNYDFEVIKVELISDIPVRKVRYLKRR
jgi:hypothetical protein